MNINMKEDIQFTEAYLKDLSDIHQTGGRVKEGSHYGSLANLLNGIAKSLKHQVKCIIQIMNCGAGNPDGSLFIKKQWDHGNASIPHLLVTSIMSQCDLLTAGGDIYRV